MYYIHIYIYMHMYSILLSKQFVCSNNQRCAGCAEEVVRTGCARWLCAGCVLRLCGELPCPRPHFPPQSSVHVLAPFSAAKDGTPDHLRRWNLSDAPLGRACPGLLAALCVDVLESLAWVLIVLVRGHAPTPAPPPSRLEAAVLEVPMYWS